MAIRYEDDPFNESAAVDPLVEAVLRLLENAGISTKTNDKIVKLIEGDHGCHQSSRPITPEELRAKFIKQIDLIVKTWSKTPNYSSVSYLCYGVAFSILALIDGASIGMPAFDLVARPHPDDKGFHQKRGENWIEDGTTINEDVELHHLFSEGERK